MKLQMPDKELAHAMSAAAIVGHARLATTPVEQLAMALAFDVGRAVLRVARRAARFLRAAEGA